MKKTNKIPKEYEAKIRLIAMRFFTEAQLRFDNAAGVIHKKNQDDHFEDVWKEVRGRNF